MVIQLTTLHINITPFAWQEIRQPIVCEKTLWYLCKDVTWCNLLHLRNPPRIKMLPTTIHCQTPVVHSHIVGLCGQTRLPCSALKEQNCRSDDNHFRPSKETSSEETSRICLPLELDIRCFEVSMHDKEPYNVKLLSSTETLQTPLH